MRFGFLAFGSGELVDDDDVDGDIGEDSREELVEDGLELSKLEKSESLSQEDDEFGGVFGLIGELESNFVDGK